MRLEFFIGFRYLLSKSKRANLVSVISFLSIIGVFLGVLVPIIVISVMSGFQNDIREKILGTSFHVVISSSTGLGIADYSALVEDLKRDEQIHSAVPFIETQGLIRHYDNYIPVRIRGVSKDIFTEDAEFDKIFTLETGKKDISKRYYMLLGHEIAKNYLIHEGARIEVWLVKKTFVPTSRPKTFTGYISGTFKTGYYEYDSGMVYTSLGTLQKVLGYEERTLNIGLKVKDIYAVDKLVDRLNEKYKNRYTIYSWQEANHNLFKALATEKIMMWIIVVLILVVAIFNVMSSQIMLVIEKKKEIGILKTMGMTPLRIMKIFLLEGVIITTIGSCAGAVIGVLFAANIKETLAVIEFIFNLFIRLQYLIVRIFNPAAGPPDLFYIFPKGIYYLDKIPADIDPMRVLTIVLFAILLSLLAGIIPSGRAAKLRPVEVIRYE
ncbi:ABC transporter permease [Spirochaetota bacterium]